MCSLSLRYYFFRPSQQTEPENRCKHIHTHTHIYMYILTCIYTHLYQHIYIHTIPIYLYLSIYMPWVHTNISDSNPTIVDSFPLSIFLTLSSTSENSVSWWEISNTCNSVNYTSSRPKISKGIEKLNRKILDLKDIYK